MDIEDNELQPQDMDYSCEFDVLPMYLTILLILLL